MRTAAVSESRLHSALALYRQTRRTGYLPTYLAGCVCLCPCRVCVHPSPPACVLYCGLLAHAALRAPRTFPPSLLPLPLPLLPRVLLLPHTHAHTPSSSYPSTNQRHLSLLLVLRGAAQQNPQTQRDDPSFTYLSYRTL
ncbi:hypothetical protein B0H14DRAFT_3429432 [Mycena olivaceomarginata]|nr:hypothetical protein B0H14DRAFT_3429432 [Mycena olivaceomarginata]